MRKDLMKIVKADVDRVIGKDREYGSSWKLRGGVGAWMVTCRKFDRIETQLKKVGWDVFRAMEQDCRDEGIMDDLNDLASYLLLIRNEAKRLRNKKKNENF